MGWGVVVLCLLVGWLIVFFICNVDFLMFECVVCDVGLCIVG